MKLKYIIVVLSLVSIFSGCVPKCSVGCGCNLFVAAVGFTRSELNTSVLMYYVQSNGANGTRYDTMNLDSAFWGYPSANDTLSDTLIYRMGYIFNGEMKLVIPAANETFSVTDVVLQGALNENQTCYEGDPNPGYCASGPVLQSYIVNGNKITCTENAPPHDTTGIIYLQK